MTGRMVYSVGVEGDRFDPHEESPDCRAAGCVPVSSVQEKPMAHPFEYHKPTDEQVARMADINAILKAAYDRMIAVVPANRGRALAITNLQQARMWINAAILEVE